MIRALRGRPLRAAAAVGVVALMLLTLQPSLGVVASAHAAPRPAGPAGDGGASELAAARSSSQQGNGPGAPAPSVAPRPATGPNASYSIEMAYDAADGYVIAVTPNVTGGIHNATYGPNDVTWKFSGGNWSVLNTTGAPPELLWPALTYDTADGYVVLFGGLEMAGSQGILRQMAYSNQTWSFASGAWTNQTSATSVQPPADEPPLMTYDAADGYVVLLDEGVTAPQTMAPTTWAFHAGAWKNVSGPANRSAPPLDGSMTYDATDGYVVFFGGLTSGPGIENYTTLPATWTYSAGNWTNVTSSTNGAPSGRIGSAMAYDPQKDAVVLFGGSTWNGPGTHGLANDTWAYSAGTWSNLSTTTPALSWYSLDLVYDGSGHQLVLAGWTNNSTSAVITTSVWLLALGGWTPAAPAMLLGSTAADVGNPFELSVELGPRAGTVSYAYSGLPTGCANVDRPRLYCTAEVPGDYRVRVQVTDGLGDTLDLSTVVVVNPAPEVLSFTSDLPVAEVGFPVSFATAATGGTGTLTFAYSGLPTGCASADLATVSCTPESPGTTEISVRATDALDVAGGTNLTLTVAPRPAVTQFLVEPSVVDVGATVVLAALTSGGVGPVQYAFGGLPLGCTSADALSVACSPVEPGSFAPSFEATDSFGSESTGAGSLTVNPAATISSFGASANRVEVGQVLDLSLTVAGGTAPYSYVYRGLPAGCTTQDAASVACTPQVPGNYSVTAVVADATGASVTRSVLVDVAPPTTLPVPHPGVGPSAGSAPQTSLFWWGLGLGAVGLVGAVVWARREVRIQREGEYLVERLRESPASSELVGAGEGPESPPPGTT